MTHQLHQNLNRSILNWFPNNKKISSNPPIFHNGKVTPDFKEKTNRFNSCTTVPTFSVLSDINFNVITRLNSFSISEKDTPIIKSLDLNLSDGWDNTLTKMMQMCGESLALALKIIFEAALNEGAFPYDWK